MYFRPSSWERWSKKYPAYWMNSSKVMPSVPENSFASVIQHIIEYIDGCDLSRPILTKLSLIYLGFKITELSDWNLSKQSLRMAMVSESQCMAESLTLKVKSTS